MRCMMDGKHWITYPVPKRSEKSNMVDTTSKQRKLQKTRVNVYYVSYSPLVLYSHVANLTRKIQGINCGLITQKNKKTMEKMRTLLTSLATMLKSKSKQTLRHFCHPLSHNIRGNQFVLKKLSCWFVSTVPRSSFVCNALPREQNLLSDICRYTCMPAMVWLKVPK